MEQVILVDEQDNEIGVEEKLRAHESGKLHRAISVFLFRKSQMLLQQRAFTKYHSGGLWTNACCSHPRPGEPSLDAAKRRLMEEMGIFCPLKKVCEFTYRAELDRGLIEHEFDHVYVGEYNSDPKPNPNEAHAWKWVEIETLQKDVSERPEIYTAWFKLLLPKMAALRKSV